MTTARLPRIESSLRSSAHQARAHGLTLVTRMWLKWRDGQLAGCCLIGACSLFGSCPPMTTEERWSVERGWDGDASAKASAYFRPEFYAIGARLSAEFRPVAASELEAA